MDNVSGHIAILAGAALAAGALAVLVHVRGNGTSAEAVQAQVVVVVPKATGEPRPPSPAGGTSKGIPRPAGPVSLARALQIELRRVGCYRGEINGAWTPATRRAMKAFSAEVNARLPVDKPDEVLLALVRGHREGACGGDRPPDSAAVPKLLVPPTPVTRAVPRTEEPQRPSRSRQSELPAGPVPSVGIYERNEQRPAR
jgi:peptidoglycan hydrolase-like protein with peptidoglycan-binding domain